MPYKKWNNPDYHRVMAMVMVFNTNFNNTSVISWRSVLLVEEIEENHKSVTNFIT